MVEPLKTRVKYSIMVLGLTWAMAAGSDTFSDPTKPPDSMLAPIQGTGQPQQSLGPVLQMVTLSKYRKSATISGQEVLLGHKYGEAVLIRVKDGEATLRNADGTLETLHMFGGVEKKTVRPEAENSARRVKSKLGK